MKRKFRKKGREYTSTSAVSKAKSTEYVMPSRKPARAKMPSGDAKRLPLENLFRKRRLRKPKAKANATKPISNMKWSKDSNNFAE